MTIRGLCQGRATLDQYSILMAADLLFQVGRFYGGQLTVLEVEVLLRGLKRIQN